MSSLIGRTLGQYEIVELIGQGGMATVYKGYQRSLDRHVAIKVLPPHPAMNEQFIQRFELEAKTVGRLQHPHILPLFDYGTEDDILYLVMGLVEGGSLSDLIDEGALPPRRVEKILREIASAMDYAHRQGVIHRDIKPGNILIDAEGHALLTDFGIVKMTQQSESADLTGTGIVGTPAYMAPEQAQGLELDERADIYALGTVVYEMLTGQQPYQADTVMQVLVKQIHDPVPSLLTVSPQMPESLDDVMQKVLAKPPDDRYSTAADFAEAFSRALHEDSDSLAAVRSQYPVNAETPRTVEATTKQPETTPLTPSSNSPTDTSPSQTIIVQQGANPLVLLAGFGLIAVVIVIIAVLLIDPGAESDDTPIDATAVADAPTDAPTTEPTVEEAPTDPPEPTPVPVEDFGEMNFSSSGGTGNIVNVAVEGLASLNEGEVYAVWMVNTETGETLSIGEIAPSAFGEGVLTYTDDEERMLPAYYNSVYLTREEFVGDEPTGDILYSGGIPIEASNSLYAIFVASEDGFDGGSLVDAARTEAGFAEQHAGLAARATSIGGLRSHAEHTINILNGTEEDYNGDERGSNPGRGVGVYFFLDRIEEHLNEAATAPNSSVELQTNVELIRVCSQNVRIWADRVIELELELLEEEEDIANVEQQATESTELTNAMTEGIDANGDGTVGPFEGECGLNQMPGFGIEIGAVTLVEGDFAESE